MQSKGHWEKVYSTKAEDEVSWFQEHAKLSLKLIQDCETPKTAAIIDIGGGASMLVDDLLSHGYQHITVLDLATAALAQAQSRLGSRASTVTWLEANVIKADLPMHSCDVWHDRAAFHFLITAEDRKAYVQKVRDTVKPGGLVIIATFSEDGPTMCSGLPTQRYSANELHAELGEPFHLIRHEKESHQTPDGNKQKFVYCVFRNAKLANS